MKFLLLSLFCVPAFGYAQLEHSLLWQISKRGEKNVSYLFGSMHTDDSLANTYSDAWWRAFNQCDIVAFEINFIESQDAAEIFKLSMMEDTVLSDLYSDEDYELINQMIYREFDSTYAAILQSMKPFHILALLMEKPADGGSFQMIMDIRLQILGVGNGKKIIGLESPSEQAASIDVLSISEQASLLLDYVKSEKKEKEENKLLEFYLSQNLDSLSSMDLSPIYPQKLITELVSKRNNRFTLNLLSAMKQGQVFCAVGAMHLTGPDGMIALLRREGFSVEPVTFHFGKE